MDKEQTEQEKKIHKSITGNQIGKISSRTGLPICQCGAGYASRFDARCTNCRSKSERRAHKSNISIKVYDQQIETSYTGSDNG